MEVALWLAIAVGGVTPVTSSDLTAAPSEPVVVEQAAAQTSGPFSGTITLAEQPITPAPVNDGRPADFWWADPKDLFGAVYGDCGLRECCKFCVIGKPCGDTCISRRFTCRVGCGCACQRPLVFVD